ncbi:MAG: hypothetical protein ACOYIG_10155 [Acetivibrionales bacterium]
MSLKVKCIVDLFKDNYSAKRKLGDTKQDYYCGITNNLEERAAWHKLPDKKYTYTYKCDSFETSSQVEKDLQDAGFYVGSEAGHGRDDSVYVYMYKIIPGVTRETADD